MASLLNRPFEGLIGKYSEQGFCRNYAIETDIENLAK
jgi:hypothetical protein